jgi:Mor family transcriptional regulator
MDLEETEVMNRCASEGHQQFNRATDQSSNWHSSKVHTAPRVAHNEMCRQQAEAMQKKKAQHIKYKRLKLGGGQAYDRSRD